MRVALNDCRIVEMQKTKTEMLKNPKYKVRRMNTKNHEKWNYHPYPETSKALKTKRQGLGLITFHV
jgi:hypothetical protein